jgi:epoxyqueuosine reductase
VTIEDRVRERAIELGFARVGFARARVLDEDYVRYEAFLSEKMQGSMRYLEDNREARKSVDTEAVLEGARSVVVCAIDYRNAPVLDEASGDRGPKGAVIARYARGQDYHNFVRKKLRRLAEFVRQQTGCESRPMLDTAPILERAWARLAGVGFVGKNGCIIAPGLGSFVLLGEVVTTAEFVEDEPMESRCGSCTLCLDACPTDAFVKPFVLDARKCVSYLTIEHRGPMPEPLRPLVGDRWFGCDDCQDVCPYNQSKAARVESSTQFSLGERWSSRTIESLLAMDEREFDRLTQGSALGRPGREGLVRNALIVLGNTGTRANIPAIERVIERETSELLRDAARWAIAAIEARDKPL